MTHRGNHAFTTLENLLQTECETGNIDHLEFVLSVLTPPVGNRDFSMNVKTQE